MDSSGVSAQSTSHAFERLDGMTSQELVDFTRDNYGPVLSYAGASLANVFRLTVDGGQYT